MIIIVLAIMIGLQAKIENDNVDDNLGYFVTFSQIFSNNQVNPASNQDNPTNPYSLNATRIGVIVCFLLACIIIFIQPFLVQNDVFRVWIHFFEAIAANNAIPILFILKHENIKLHAIKKIKSHFCGTNANDPIIVLTV
jgi:hypothetical protein